MTATPDRVRTARSRAARIGAGGKPLYVMLTPGAAIKLAKWVSLGLTAASVVSRMLEQSKPPRARKVHHEPASRPVDCD